MDLELRVPLAEGETGEGAVPFITNLVTSAANFVGVDADEAVGKLVIADEDSFGPAVHELQTSAGRTPSYTDNDVHKAVAKTIALHDGGRTVNAIVVRDFVIGLIAEASQGGNDIAAWDDTGQLYFYALTHEVGHCKDNLLRPEEEEVPIMVGGRFSIRQVARYYFSILAGEFAACVHSAAVVTDRLHEQHTQAWRDDVGSLLAEVERLMWEYQRDHSKLYDLAVNASQAFWVIIVQYAKLIGSMVGNEGLDQTPPAWPGDDQEADDVLKGLAAALREMWGDYPAWSDSAAEKFFDLWNRLALAHGYRFVEGPEGVALFLDRQKIFGDEADAE